MFISFSLFNYVAALSCAAYMYTTVSLQAFEFRSRTHSGNNQSEQLTDFDIKYVYAEYYRHMQRKEPVFRTRVHWTCNFAAIEDCFGIAAKKGTLATRHNVRRRFLRAGGVRRRGLPN